MIAHNAYYELFASVNVPNPDQVGYWVDLGASPKGKIIKVFNKDIRKWVTLLDASGSEYVAPFIGVNGHWYVDNRDTGILATAANPYIGDNGNWYVYDATSKSFIDSGEVARGKTAYDIAVEYGYTGTEEEWVASLSAASESAAEVALAAANNANEAAATVNTAVESVDAAVDAATSATETAIEAYSNPPKIVNETWWLYDLETQTYIDSGVSAVGDAFTYVKEYASVTEMEADYDTEDVGVGQFVMINTGDVEDEDDAKVYLKTLTGWQFVVDLSGMQGIQGWSAYELAVNNGYVGTEEEWIASLKEPAETAATVAYEAIEAVEATETALEKAEASRVTTEESRVDAEAARATAEETRVTAETERETAEAVRQANEETRQTQEEERQANAATAITNAEAATAAATEAAEYANTEASVAAEYNDHQPKVGSDGYWYTWDVDADEYVNTGWSAVGINVKGSYTSKEELILNVVDPAFGDAYFVESSLYVYDGAAWNEINLLGGVYTTTEVDELIANATGSIDLSAYSTTEEMTTAINTAVSTLESSVESDISTLQAQVDTNTADIATNASAIAANTSDIATNTSAIATNAANIATNTSDIATNAANIASNTADIAANTASINENAEAIANNTADIATNTANITTNTNDIATNTASIADNTANIAINTSDIATNASNISVNAANIATNTSNIATNAAAIADNTSAIATNAEDVAALETRVSTAESNISTNTEDIATNTSNISVNATNIATNTEDIASLEADLATLEAAVATKADQSTTYTMTEVDSAISAAIASVYRVMGSVDTYDDLPTTDVTVGDVYNVLDTGANYVATATTPEWDKLSETIDLSGYSTTTEVNSAIESAISDINATINDSVIESLDAKVDKVEAGSSTQPIYCDTDGVLTACGDTLDVNVTGYASYITATEDTGDPLYIIGVTESGVKPAHFSTDFCTYVGPSTYEFVMGGSTFIATSNESELTLPSDSGTLALTTDTVAAAEGVVASNVSSTISFWIGTEDEYDALSTYSSTTLYIITE